MLLYFPEPLQNADVSILIWIQEHLVNPVCDVFFSLVTHLGYSGIFWILVAIALVCFKRTRKTGLMVGAALLLGLIFGNGILKNLFARVRPYDLENAFLTETLVKKPSDWSFPSGHTLASFEAAAVLMIRDKRFGVPALVLAILIAFSRLYLYIHFPSDVVAGLLLGVLFGFCGVWIVGTIWKYFENRRKSVW